MDEILKEMNAAIEEYQGRQPATQTAEAVDLGLLKVVLPYLVKLVIKDAALQAKLIGFIPALVAFIENVVNTFVPTPDSGGTGV